MFLIYDVAMIKGRLRQLLKQNGLSVTIPRLKILTILDQTNGPLSVENIVRESENAVALSTVYRVVADLLDANIVNTFSSPEQKLLVELSTVKTAHHHHLYCESCEKVFDISLAANMELMIEKVINEIKKAHNLQIKDHSFEIYGTCNNVGNHD